MANKIERIINELDRYVEGCRNLPMSQEKAIVERDVLYDLIDELKVSLPNELSRYKKIVANRDAIMDDAERKAQIIISNAQNEAAKTIMQAKRQADSMISENEIMQQVYCKANQLNAQSEEEASRMISQATEDSNQIRENALSYTNTLLTKAEKTMSIAYKDAMQLYENTLSSLQENLVMVSNNKSEVTTLLYPDDKDQDLLTKLENEEIEQQSVEHKPKLEPRPEIKPKIKPEIKPERKPEKRKTPKKDVVDKDDKGEKSDEIDKDIVEGVKIETLFEKVTRNFIYLDDGDDDDFDDEYYD